MILLENVRYRYPFQKEDALKDIDLQVIPGEAVLITGPSGCGKSTLGRLINGLIPSYFEGTLLGKVELDGRSGSEYTTRDLSHKVGSLFQDPEQQFLSTNVDDELRTALEWRGLSTEEIDARLEPVVRRLGLEHKRSSSLFSLSEGEKQKVALASILALKPQILMLDEPTANLDERSTLELLHILRELKEEGMTIVIFDHRLYWLRTLVDHAYLMRDGTISRELPFDALSQYREEYGLRSLETPEVEPPQLTIGHLKRESGCFLDALSFGYTQKEAVFRNFSGGVPAGKVVAICGRNGSGKTTLARLAMGLEKLQEGAILFEGEAQSVRKRQQRNSLVLQNTELQLYMRTVEEELQCSTPSDLENPAPVSTVLDRFQLHGLEKRHPQSLSGGQRQRLVTACALQKQPEVLILDEPTSGLDGKNMRLLANQARAFAEKGAAVALITHDYELINTCCDYVWNLETEPPMS